ncbi:Myelin regulatory factor [Nymphon striatum]|nr:Myelin regulatory factor [Nymphon striatum]
MEHLRGREELGGIDNEGLDFSQLEDYINDDRDAANLYFPEGLVGTNSQTKINSFSAIDPSVSSKSSSTIASSEYGSPPSLYIQVINYHNLPDSPPDSSSEPPYSPDNENKMNSGIMNSVRGVVHSNHNDNNAEKPYHAYENYNNTLPLKHLPEVVLPAPPNPMPLPVGATTNDHLTPLQVQISGTQPIIASSTANLVHMNGGNVMTHPSYLEGQCSNNNHLPPPPPSTMSPIYTIPIDSSIYTPSKKRKLNESLKTNHSNLQNNVLNNPIQVKHEPGISSDHPVNSGSSNQCGNALEDDQFNFEHNDQSIFMDPTYQCIRFQDFQPNSWHTICDRNLTELPPPHYRVDADKGFNFSHSDNSFVCQKKNHFQITAHVQLSTTTEPHYVKTPEGLKPIDSYHIHFYGVKVESQSQTIRVEQSQSDRSKKAFHPIPIELLSEKVSKVTVGRMHFSETTSNNMRKKGKPNPDQRYFYLVVSLNAHSGDNSYMIISRSSDRIIVRASNPGQFENDADVSWQKGQTSESIYHAGRVGVNTDQPDEALVIHGNLKITGHLVQPSDYRAKENIQEIDSKVQLQNVSQMRIVKYRYETEYAKHAGLSEGDKNDTGVIAQEVKIVLPDAVKEAGDVILPSGKKIDSFLVVNKERIFMENVGAVKELCKVTDNLENRIDELERMNQKLRLKRIDSLKSTSSASTVTSCSSSKVKRRVHHRCKHNRGENNCVTNRPVQITIFVLVLVMACCLISMATLYVYENRNNSYKNRDHYSDQIATKHNYCSRILLIFVQSGHGTDIPIPITLSPRPAEKLPPPVVGRPPNCQDLTIDVKDCPVYCCSGPKKSFQYNVDKPEGIMFESKPAKTMIRTHASSRAMDLNKISSAASSSNSLLSNSDTSDLMSGKELSNDEIKGNKVPLLGDHVSNADHTLLTPAPSMQWTSRASNNHQQVIMNYNRRFIRSVNNNVSNVKKSKVKLSSLSLLLADGQILISVPEFKFVLNSDYCVKSDCTTNRALKMSYEIPFSKYMNLDLVHLLVNTTSVPGTTFNFCKYVPGQNCEHSSIADYSTADPKYIQQGGKIVTSSRIPLMKYTVFTVKGRLTKTSNSDSAPETEKINRGCDVPSFKLCVNKSVKPLVA